VAADREYVVRVDQRATPPIDGMFTELGVYQFEQDTPAEIIVSNDDADGHVIVDAVQLIRTGE